MPTQEEVFASIVDSVQNGAGMELSDEAIAALRARYFAWIVKAGMRHGRTFSSPLEIWDGPVGDDLRRKFEEIGRRARRKTTDRRLEKLSAKDAEEDALSVESESDCPWCRP